MITEGVVALTTSRMKANVPSVDELQPEVTYPFEMMKHENVFDFAVATLQHQLTLIILRIKNKEICHRYFYL
jgi:hypothetical protein